LSRAQLRISRHQLQLPRRSIQALKRYGAARVHEAKTLCIRQDSRLSCLIHGQINACVCVADSFSVTATTNSPAQFFPRFSGRGLVFVSSIGFRGRVNADFDGRSNGHWGSKQRKSLRLWMLQQGLAVFIIYSHPKSSQAWLTLGVSRIVNDREPCDERKSLSYKLLCRRWPKCHAYPRFRLGKVCVDPGFRGNRG